MGTKLEYAFNLLAPSPNSTSFNVHCVDELDYLQTRELNISFLITGLDKHHSLAYDKMPEKQNLDFIRKTMQMHEETFKHQVRELHRLYSVQKMLMDEQDKEIKQNKKYWNPRDTNYLYSLNFQGFRDDHPSPKERSGSCSGETMRMTTLGIDLERPAAEEDISTAISTAIDDTRAAGTSSFIPLKGNDKMSIDGSDEESEVELTLSIGRSSTSSKKMIMSTNQEMGFSEQMHKRMKELDSPASVKSERRGEDCSTPTTPMSSSSATFDHERKQPNWLFQGLSINRT
ncbi:hypothetical protein P3X46_024118 [Hevea brasiliensis]|uniref:Uncharacterized protein n=3 Tax=Hevea brasiliensis TaxID=3981 RepID=A0ABQ9L1I9_HEVBR|nr:uncharacterized protein LOC110650664 isoform X2 [Hevea brasiliensis]XP_057991402.1 uncharacterized protein LOC131173302 isoform X2 [Hevea brasiliensis]KAF2309569.1 hypothetical protein GH714_003862 [Hevea brasiliensis]KAJ9141364.1 hypothetical protein P3X46_031906 [Hevea brasiliensis]KAJ9158547.1 hypothetical protein P3X46_024118 [Hevea brasiliensis]